MKFPLIAVLAATTILAGLAPGKAHAAPGDLYVASSGNSTIVRITPGGAASVFAQTQVAFGYDYPAYLAFDSSGNLYVANNHEDHGYGPPANDEILRFTPSGVRSVFATVGPDPQGLAFDASGNLYVANTGSLNIERITPDGVASVFADTGLNQPLGVAQPVGLAFDASGNLYTSLVSVSTSPFSSTIERFTPAGVASVFASTGLDEPQGLAFDASGNLYASLFSSSSFSTTIERFTPGGVASVFASTGENRSDGLAFDASGNLYVSNSDNTIERFTPGGVGSVLASSGLQEPFGLAFEPVVSPAAVPEPASLALLAVGVASLGLTRRKRARAAGDRA